MKIRVLGSAAGGGFPQWNCGCPNCAWAREHPDAGVARTQETVAVSADGASWFLLNASPEIRAQLESFPALHPRELRHSPVRGILLTNGDLDHTLGLLSLRESHPLHVYATDAVRRGFTDGNVLYRTLERFAGQVTWHTLRLFEERPLLDAGAESGLFVTAVPVPGKPPVHLEGLVPGVAEEGIGVVIRDAARGTRLAYFSSFGGFTPPMEEAMRDADFVFLDGTFWSPDEMPKLGAGTKEAKDMAHAPLAGPGGTLARAAHLGGRRVLIHVNNTNPILLPHTEEAAFVRRAGFEVAYDGLELGS